MPDENLLPITKKQRLLALGVFEGKEHFRAAVDAGYSSRGKKKNVILDACKTLAKTHVKAFLDNLRKQAVEKLVVSKQQVLKRLNDIGDSNIFDIVAINEDGNKDKLKRGIYLKSLEDIPVEVQKNIKSIQETDDGYKVTFWDKIAANKEINNMLGYTTGDKTERPIINMQINIGVG
jgi:phage terminase small subunit